MTNCILGTAGDEQQKLQQEYQEYQKKLEQQKAEYRKDHPDEVNISFVLNNYQVSIL